MLASARDHGGGRRDACGRLGVAPFVVDPVAASQHGDPLLRPDALDALRGADHPAGHAGHAEPRRGAAADRHRRCASRAGHGRRRAARCTTSGPQWVLVKGGHLPSGDAVDLLYDGTDVHRVRAPRGTDTPHTHGSGDTLAAAIDRRAGPRRSTCRTRSAEGKRVHHRRGRRLVPARRRARPGRPLLADQGLARRRRVTTCGRAEAVVRVTSRIGRHSAARSRVAKAAAAAPGSLGLGDRPDDDDAAGAARDHLVQPLERLDAADGEPRPLVLRARPACVEQLEAGGRTARLGRRRPGRPGSSSSRRRPRRGRRRPAPGTWVERPMSTSVADDLARDRHRQVVLAQVQDRRADRPGDVGAVVDREQRAVPLGSRGEHLEQPRSRRAPRAPSPAAARCRRRCASTASRKSARSPVRERESVHRYSRASARSGTRRA